MAAPIESLTSGVHVLAANVQYALPAKITRVHVTGAGVTQISNDGSTWEATTPDGNGEFLTSGVFIRSVAGATISIRT